MELQYEPAWIQSDEGRPLSLSLPFSLDNAPIKGRVVDHYFDNLLPDSDPIRQRIKARFNTESTNPFDLLAAIGRDCAGAVQLLPPGEGPGNVETIDAEPLDETAIEAALIDTTSPAPMRSLKVGELRISIAGAQEKSAFLRHEGKWCRALGTTPTSHIFKLPLGLIGGIQADMRSSLENEWLCSRILRAYGVPIANCEIGQFGSQKVLIVERFDRQLHSGSKYWLRLVQEDFCQAMGLPSSMKYEADDGPGILEIAQVLRGSENRDKDLETFLKAQILFWMLAAGDGHAKNFSIRILRQGRYHLTPLYDVLSYYPIIGEAPHKISWHAVKMAMAVRGKNKHYLIKDILRRHFNQTAARSGIGESAEPIIKDILTNTPDVVAAVQSQIPEEFPKNVAEAILRGLTDSAKRLAAMTP